MQGQTRRDALDNDAEQTLQALINGRLIELIGTRDAELVREFQVPEWLALDPAAFNFRMFQHLKFDADVMQEILELRSAYARLDLIWSIQQQA